MAANDSAMRNSRLIAMVVPREHGAWGMLLVPLAAGAAVAAGTARNVRALGLFLVAAFALFWFRTPLEAWMGTSPIKAHSGPERTTVLGAAIALLCVACIAVSTLFWMGYSLELLVIGAVAALSFALQASVKRLGRRGRMPAQVIGAIGLASTAAGAYYVATGRLDRVAVALWTANWLFANNQVHFVQMRIHASRAGTLREKLNQGYGFIGGQIVLLAVVTTLSRLGYFPKFAVIAFIPAVVRGAWWFISGRQPLDVHKLGFSELFQSVVFAALLCVVFLV